MKSFYERNDINRFPEYKTISQMIIPTNQGDYLVEIKKEKCGGRCKFYAYPTNIIVNGKIHSSGAIAVQLIQTTNALEEKSRPHFGGAMPVFRTEIKLDKHRGSIEHLLDLRFYFNEFVKSLEIYHKEPIKLPDINQRR